MILLEHLRPHPIISLGINPESDVFDTSTKLEQGANYLIEAASGKGKSTLLHILFGLRLDYDGDVQLNERNIRLNQPDQWSELRQDTFAIVFQDLRLFPDLTARQNIKLNQQMEGSISDERVEEMATRLGIQHLLDQPAATLSYGQRQRVAIIRALAQSFRYLLLDEPFSHLDAGNTQKASALIQERAQENQAGIIMSSLGERFDIPWDRELVI
jgi:ABC-type lipoprotein export system ATPase subunit